MWVWMAIGHVSFNGQLFTCFLIDRFDFDHVVQLEFVGHIGELFFVGPLLV